MRVRTQRRARAGRRPTSTQRANDVQKQHGGMSSGAAAQAVLIGPTRRWRTADAANVPTLGATDILLTRARASACARADAPTPAKWRVYVIRVIG